MCEKNASHARYALWRFNMWLAGYGSYDTIDEAVRNRRLDPATADPDDSTTWSAPPAKEPAR